MKQRCSPPEKVCFNPWYKGFHELALVGKAAAWRKQTFPEENKGFQYKTKVSGPKTNLFSKSLLKTQNSKQTWPQRVWKLWKQTFFHVFLFVCFPANFCFKLVGPEFVFRVETNLFRKRFFLPKTNLFEKQFFVCFSPYGQPRWKTFVFLAETNLSKLSKLDRARCFSSAYPFVRSGRERKKKRFFPFFCGEKVCRNKKNTRAFGQRKRSEERRVGKECRSRWSPYH